MAEPAQRASHHADHLKQISGTSPVRRRFGRRFRRAIVDQGNVQSLHEGVIDQSEEQS